MKKIVLLLLLILSLTSLSGCSAIENAFNLDFESWFDFENLFGQKNTNEYVGEYRLHHIDFKESGNNSTFYLGDSLFGEYLYEDSVQLTVNIDGLVGGHAYNGYFFPTIDLGGKLYDLDEFVITLNHPYDFYAGYRSFETVEVYYDGSFWVLKLYVTSEITLVNYLNKVS